jgi:hypothetical protein
MLIGYILTKTGGTKLKFIRNGISVFIWKGCEYQVDFSKKREKRFFGMKTFFWIMWEQDNPLPLDFNAGQVIRANQDIPINEMAYFMNLLRGNLLMIIAMCSAGALICSLLAIYYCYQNSVDTASVLAYVKAIWETVKPVVPQPIVP